MKGVIRAETCSPRQVVRVAVTNNFSCTKAEWAQLDQFRTRYPYRLFFVNSNIKTPRLVSINDHDYQAVITTNPDLTVDPRLIERVSQIDPRKIAFLRVKWLPEDANIQGLVTRLLASGHRVVITMQRFNGRASLLKYSTLNHYHWDHNRYRLSGDSLKVLHEYVDRTAAMGYPLYICDRAGLGCGGCGLCSKLTVGDVLPLRSLNLSSSGLCPYRCPDCYAHTLQDWLLDIGQPPIQFDEVKANKKQSGTTKHIKDARAALQR